MSPATDIFVKGTPMGRKDQVRCDNLHDFLIDVIVDTDEDEVDGGNVGLFNAAIASGETTLARRRLQAAKDAVRGDRLRQPASDLEKERARRRLATLKTGANDDGANLTLAARFGKESVDDEVDGLLEDLAELERSRRDD
jgi:hypothetical protein